MTNTAIVPRRAARGALWRAGSSVIMGLTGVLGKSFLYGLNRVHLEGLDDPVIWGVLPLRYAFDPWNLRWSLGAQDICFKNKINPPLEPLDLPPPHPHPHLSWVHVFPEGCVHQHPTSSLRYFKWGISRLLLESDPTPDFVPMFIDGTQRVMAEDRTFPRFLPRIGKDITVAFGDPVDGEGPPLAAADPLEPPRGVDPAAWQEVVDVRIETARRVRDQVAALRTRLGYPDDDVKLELAETWKREKVEDAGTTTLGQEHVSSKR
ncbi:unnamed protein product [Parascedosporium putredinis]|uniref:Tafazzin family protein n=1 Tax=Parascedosporium putredinis TaxID=1442378 RepID=A0A9P1MEX1_9PEZI|nr:unnamed protein product [Parascedosporium putredinis]CAI8003789.1 unnamed protein product [Parascedosporium putredinis]